MPRNCDHAFESVYSQAHATFGQLTHDTGRIHFSVNYPELDFDSRKIIWATFFKRSSTDISDEQLGRLASYRINGRQVCFPHPNNSLHL